MTAKDDLIVMGVVGVGLLGGLYLVSRGIGDLMPKLPKLGETDALTKITDSMLDNLNAMSDKVASLGEKTLALKDMSDNLKDSVDTIKTDLEKGVDEVKDKMIIVTDTIDDLKDGSANIIDILKDAPVVDKVFTGAKYYGEYGVR